ncbi:Elicitin [Phytophthora cactorum]|nr:Elicitin [Phytophthora cactorum]
MKITLGTILLLNAAAFFGGIAAAPCDTTALSKLLMNENVKTCRADSGYNAASMTAATDAQVTAVCNSKACTEAMKTLKEVAPQECTIGPIRLYADVIDPLSNAVEESRGSVGAGSANASAPGSGPSVGDVGSGSVAKSPTTTKPRTNAPTSSPSTTPRNGGSDTFSLSAFGAVAVLATVVAAIL